MDLASDMLRRTITIRIANVEDFQELLRTCVMKSTKPFFLMSRVFGCSTMVPREQRYLRIGLRVHSATIMLACIASFCVTLADLDIKRDGYTDVTFLHVSLILSNAFVLVNILWARLVELKLSKFVKHFKAVTVRGLKEQNSSISTWLCIAYICVEITYTFVLCTLQLAGVIRLPVRSILLEKTPVLAYVAVPTCIFFFTGARCCCVCLQILMVICVRIATRQYNWNLSQTKELNLELVSHWRREFGKLVQLMRFLESCWKYYFAVFHLISTTLLCIIVYIFSTLDDHGTRMVLIGTLASNLTLIAATQVPAIMANEEIKNSHRILLQKEAEIVVHVPNSEKTEYYHQLGMLRAEMGAHEDILISSGGAFKISRFSLVLNVGLISVFILALSLFRSGKHFELSPTPPANELSTPA